MSGGEVRPQVLFLDIGQGDAAVLVGNGVRGMVDAGPSWGKFSVANEIFLQLTGLGITSLDFIALSHGDRDHWGGIPDLIRSLPVGRLWVHPGVVPRVPAVRAAAWEQGIALRTVGSPRWSPSDTGGWWWYPLWGNRSNNQGLVLIWESHGCRFGFLGDLEADGEALFLQHYRGSLDVLKVSHHGSKSSSTPALLARLKPRWAVVSAGADNPYGHPHRSVLDRLRGSGAEVLRTDFHGFVRFTSAGHGRLRCETAEGGCGVGNCHPHKKMVFP